MKININNSIFLSLYIKDTLHCWEKDKNDIYEIMRPPTKFFLPFSLSIRKNKQFSWRFIFFLSQSISCLLV